MGQVQQSIVVALGMEQAQNEWRAYVYRDEVGASLGPEGRLAADAQGDVEQELVTFEEAGPGSTRVTLRADFDEERRGRLHAARRRERRAGALPGVRGAA